MASGDISAFELVFKENFRSLSLTALGLCRDDQIAQDAVQESFMYLWNHRRKINPELSVESYLHTCVRHYVLNYLRHRKVMKKREGEVLQEQLFLHEADEDLTPRIEFIREALECLPEKCQKIFILSVVEGMSYAETAEALGVSVNTVKSQVKIAYKKIRKTIKENPGLS